VRARLPSIFLRLLVLTGIWVLGTATVTLAQENGSTTSEEQPAPTSTPAPTAPQPGAPEVEAAPEPLIVPDVRGLPYVFAKGLLDDRGFAWEVTGKVEGYAVNLVVEQNVKPGIRVEDTGFPVIQLRLGKNPPYEARGIPENASSYEGTDLIVVKGSAKAEAPPAEAPEENGAEGSATEPATTEPAATEPAATEPAATGPATTNNSSSDYEAAPQTVDATPASSPAKRPAKAAAVSTKRLPAFVVPGAPREPLDEITLPRRARALQARLADKPRPTQALIDFWQYQHAWIVTGAQFGWWHGAEALRILIRVDEDLQERWHTGANSEAVARAALAEVLRRSR
jgi:hypothetical protein